MTLIAEDVLLLLLDDSKGTVSTWGNTDAVLGGAVLAELAVLGLATVDEKKSIWRAEKVHATGAAPADLDPVLAEALATIAEKDRTASTLVTKLGKGLDDRLAAGLAERRHPRAQGRQAARPDPADHLARRRHHPRGPAASHHHRLPRRRWPARRAHRCAHRPALGRRPGAQGGRAQPRERRRGS